MEPFENLNDNIPFFISQIDVAKKINIIRINEHFLL